MGSLGHFLIKTLPFSPFRDRDGYAGFIPSAGYFKRFYDQLIESWSGDMQQHMAMLSARVLSVDHSFKVRLVYATLGS